MKRLAIATLALTATAPALAQESAGPRFCPDRPSLGSSGCTTDPGRVQFEFSALDWQLDNRRDQRSDSVVASDLLARVGVTPTTEVQLGWTAFGHVRTRDKLTGAISSVNGVGDVTFGVRQNLKNPEGSGFSFAIQPQVTLPVGREPIGAGDWAAGVLLPVTYSLSSKVSLGFTGEVDAAVDGDGDGQHLAYSGIWGAGYGLSDKLSATAELSLQRDNDSAGHKTQSLAALSLAYRPRKTLQLDVLAVAGLNRTSPDVELVTGGAILF